MLQFPNFLDIILFPFFEQGGILSITISQFECRLSSDCCNFITECYEYATVMDISVFSGGLIVWWDKLVCLVVAV